MLPALSVATSAGLLHGTGASAQSLVFEPVTSPGNQEIPIRSIWGTAAGDVWAVGGNQDADMLPRGRVLHWDGTDWGLDDISSEPFAFTRVWGSPVFGTWIGGA